ncbi:hypothetical protein HY224_00285 [Candidatus Uhrbacteria bacterium]|nr:hypothetical protein [Candidatus Uhrbacteria bacterium]
MAIVAFVAFILLGIWLIKNSTEVRLWWRLKRCQWHLWLQPIAGLKKENDDSFTLRAGRLLISYEMDEKHGSSGILLHQGASSIKLVFYGQLVSASSSDGIVSRDPKLLLRTSRTIEKDILKAIKLSTLSHAG